jgi:large subunit ribosomal protein L17
MRHGKRNIKFGRHAAHRDATLASLVRNLVIYKRIETTLAKAKEAKGLADRLISWGKKGGLHQRRLAYSLLGDRDLVGTLFKDIAPLFTKRNGGYTRVMLTRRRVGDNAQMAILEWTELKPPEPVEPKKKTKKEVKKEQAPQPEVKREEKPKAAKLAEEKPKAKTEQPPRTEEKKPKGILGGLRKFFNRKSPN